MTIKQFVSAIGLVVVMAGVGAIVNAQNKKAEPVERAPASALTELQQTKAILAKVQMDDLEKQKALAKLASDLATCQQQQLAGAMKGMEGEFLKQLGAGTDKAFDWATMQAVPKQEQKASGVK